MRTIAFLAEKGGVGKSSLCINIAAALISQFQRRVLLVDLDGLSSLTQTLAPEGVPFGETVAAALIGLTPIEALARETPYANLHIVPSSVQMKILEDMDLSETPSAAERCDSAGRLLDTALASELAGLPSGAYDYVLIDCPGGVRFIEQMALLACDEVVIPTGLSVLDFYGLTPTLELVADAQAVRDGKPTVLGFLLNGASSKGIPPEMNQFLQGYSLPLFSPVRASQTMKSAPGRPKLEKRLVVVSQPQSTVALSIVQVAREIEMGIEAARAYAAAAADATATSGDVAVLAAEVVSGS